MGRAICKKNLHGAEAELQKPLQAVLHAVGQGGVAGVAEDALLLRPAQQLVHRPPQQLALEVPQRQVDGAHGVAGEAAGAERGRRAPHQVPRLLGGGDRLPRQQRGEVVVDDRRHRRTVQRQAEAPGAVVRGRHACHRQPVGGRGAARLRIAVQGTVEVAAGARRHPRRRLRPRRQVDAGGADLLYAHTAGYSSGAPAVVNASRKPFTIHTNSRNG